MRRVELSCSPSQWHRHLHSIPLLNQLLDKISLSNPCIVQVQYRIEIKLIYRLNLQTSTNSIAMLRTISKGKSLWFIFKTKCRPEFAPSKFFPLFIYFHLFELFQLSIYLPSTLLNILLYCIFKYTHTDRYLSYANLCDCYLYIYLFIIKILEQEFMHFAVHHRTKGRLTWIHTFAVYLLMNQILNKVLLF